MVCVALLRGINLAGNRRMKMDHLRELCESLDFQQVRTHIQSGNIVFRTSLSTDAAVIRSLEDNIEKTFGFRSDVIVRNLAEMRVAVANNPFRDRSNIDPARLLVTFLASKPASESREKLHSAGTPEEIHLVGRELYIYYPDGMSGSRLPANFIDKAVKVPATARNWNTVTKLLEMAESLGAGK